MTTEGRRADDWQRWQATRHVRAMCFGWSAILWMMAPFASVPVLADSSRCNCSQVVGTCRATIQFRSNRILIESSRLECSKVTWYTNGQPRTSIVLDGEENIEWLGSTPPSIEIQSCEVCVDRSNPYDRDTAFSGSATQATLVAIPPPAYPAEYRRIGLEGRVVVAFQVDVMGRARNEESSIRQVATPMASGWHRSRRHCRPPISSRHVAMAKPSIARSRWRSVSSLKTLRLHRLPSSGPTTLSCDAAATPWWSPAARVTARTLADLLLHRIQSPLDICPSRQHRVPAI